ncbi:50S ribosome-binding GTPase [Candidatus Pacearchaeota archaeon]|nr:50S ribosome-binding GTPase [Candidatus Pacearchaeota archaeon]
MSSTNQSPEFLSAQKRYLSAKNDEEKLFALEEMLKTMPKHKGAEEMRANLKTRFKKLKLSMEEKKKKKSFSKEGIKKEEMQAVLIGLANSGKSSILSCLTNASSQIADYEFTTRYPIIGMLDFDNTKIQLIDLPAVESEYFDQGIANTADTLLIVIENPSQFEKIFPFLEKTAGSKLIILNKIDLLEEKEKRRMSAFLQSKKYNFILFSSKTKENIHELKEKIWKTFNKIRIYTKQPGKPADSDPVILPEKSTVKDIAEKIFHGLSENIKETKVTGPSSKFPNQKVSLKHTLKDRDIVEFCIK